jgi:hypothetical protein
LNESFSGRGSQCCGREKGEQTERKKPANDANHNPNNPLSSYILCKQIFFGRATEKKILMNAGGEAHCCVFVGRGTPPR